MALAAPNVMERKEKDPLHAPDEPMGDRLPVEPEMQKGFGPDPVPAKTPKDKPVDKL